MGAALFLSNGVPAHVQYTSHVNVVGTRVCICNVGLNCGWPLFLCSILIIV